jgi:nucleoside-diphosphate-sugar epimerase
MILVTGGNGRLGRILVPTLLKSHDVRVLDRDARLSIELFKSHAGEHKHRLEAMELDVARGPGQKLVQACQGIDYVIHLAALVDYAASEKELMVANWLATARLCEAAKRAKCKGIVYISSTSVYGRRPNYLPIDEKHPLHPSNAYGRSKFLAEDTVRRSRLPHVILRPCLMYGPAYEEGFSQVLESLRKGSMKLIGSGDNKIALVHVQDVANAITLALKALESGRVKNQAFNICGEALTQKKALEAGAKSLGVAMPGKSVPKWLAYIGVALSEAKARLLGRRPKMFTDYVSTLAEERWFSSDKAKRMLGWRPKATFQAWVKAYAKTKA